MSSIDKFYSIFEREKLLNAIELAYNRKNDITWISLIISIISTTILLYKNICDIVTLQNKKTEVSLFLIVSTLVIGAILVFLIVWFYKSLNKWMKNREYTLSDIKKDIFDSEIEHEHNDVFIVKASIENTPKLLFRMKSGWGFMLPYYETNKDLSIKDIENEFIKRFNGIRVVVKYLEHLELRNVIKYKPNTGYRKFSYTFYYVKVNLSYHNFKNQVEREPSLAEYCFKSLVDVKGDLLTMKSNSDIVNYLAEENAFHYDDSFVDKSSETLPTDLKVIWNITDQCSFKCKFCATKRNTQIDNELLFENRIFIADELKKIEGVKLDFAGGDPLYDCNTKNVIKHISYYMSNITITSTSVGLCKLDTDELSDMCRNYDISYDYPSTWKNQHRGNQYNNKNYETINKMIKCGYNINILVTLSNHNTDDITIKAMISELQALNPNMITLLRLMPVGKQRYDNYPSVDTYNPSNAIQMFKNAFANKVKLHCAFRAHMDGGEECHCNLLKKKIGIDNNGNLYACAWAGYLPIDNNENPFYLGNILQSGINTIFKSRRYEDLVNSIEKSSGKFCKIFSYSENNKNGLIDDHDIYAVKYSIQ